MKVLDGHLTVLDKKCIKLMFDNKLTSSKINKKNYFIIADKNNIGVYTIKIKVMNRGLIPVAGSPLRLSTYTNKIKL